MAGRCGAAATAPAAADNREAEQATVCLLNNRRDGLGSVGSNGDLTDAANGHNRRMLAERCFSHRCDGEPDLEGRVRRSGYLGGGRWGVGEVLANAPRGGTPAETVRAWMDSPEHRDVILTGAYEHVGVSIADGTPDDPGGGGATYTVDFGFRSG